MDGLPNTQPRNRGTWPKETQHIIPHERSVPKKTWPITTRNLAASLPGWENARTEAAVCKRFAESLCRTESGFRRPSRILLSEFDGLQGRPDLVDANIIALPCSVSLDALANCLRSPTKARLLALLRYGAPRRPEYLLRSTGLSKPSLRTHLRELEGFGLVLVNDDGPVSLACRLPWNMVHMVAYEIKVSNWKRGLHQAVGYRSFAHSSWIVMPAPAASRAEAVESVFRNNGVGLMSMGDSGCPQVEIRAKTHRTTTSRRLYLMAVGIVLSAFLKEQRRLHRRLRPESVQCV